MESFDWPSDQELKQQKRQIRKKVLLIALSSIIVIVGVALYLIYHVNEVLSSLVCENQAISREAQPNGRLELVVFQRNCGATKMKDSYKGVKIIYSPN